MEGKYHWYQCSASQCQVLSLASCEDALHRSGLFLKVVPYIKEDIWHFSYNPVCLLHISALVPVFFPPAYECQCLCLVGWIFVFQRVALSNSLFSFDV